jgi:hypothetical protein
MNAEEITALLTRHVAILNSLDEASRPPAIAEVYAENLHFVDPHQEFTGRVHFNGFVQNLHRQFPGAIFRLAQPIDTHHTIARLSWQFGPPANPAAVTGQDIAVVADGQIQALYVFLNKAA